MSLAYPGESSALSDFVGRDAFLEVFNDQTRRVRILEKEPKNVDEALNIASRLEAFDIMGFAGPEGEKNKSRFARVVAGGKEFTSSEGAKAPEETAKQIADLKVLISDNCRNCGERGNWARECRAAEERRNAPALARNNGGSVSIVTAGRNGVGVYLALTLHGRGVYGLLDTGCDTSVISRCVIPNEPLKSTTQKLFAANGTEIALLGEAELTMTMSGHEVTATVVVSDEVDYLILGIDWLGSHRCRCRWSFAQNLIEIDGEVVRLISRPRQNML